MTILLCLFGLRSWRYGRAQVVGGPTRLDVRVRACCRCGRRQHGNMLPHSGYSGWRTWLDLDYILVPIATESLERPIRVRRAGGV